jgi:hypothetical protein
VKLTNILESNEGTQASTRENLLFRVLLAAMVICGSFGLTTANASYPFLKLDLGPSHNVAATQEGFTAMTVSDSGIVIDGITIEVGTTQAGETIQQRDRGAIGVPNALIYRDFWFTVNGGLTLTLSGLESNETYEITLYSWDQSSAEYHIADWSANGEYCLTTSWTNSILPATEEDYAFSGNATADANGMIVLEAAPNPETSYPGPPGQYFCFVNAVVVSTLTPFNVARRPIPEDGAIITTNEITLQWTPGYTSVSSNVYIGESFNDVNEATTADTDNFRGNSEVVSFPIGSAGNPYPDGLTEETTYYWRIDEVEEDGTENKGDIWSFTVAPKTAFTPFPIDGSLFADPNGTLSWLPGADSVEHHVFFGDNLDDVQADTGGTDKGTMTDPNYTPGLLERNKTYYWRIDESDGANTYTGDVWSFTTSLPEIGTITMDIWENVEGDHTLPNLLNDPRYPDNPTRSEALTELGTVNGVGDGYGAQIYGWLYCPVTGDYTFYLSSAGQGELWLSTNDDPANIVLLASESTWGAYNSFSIKSVPISLVAGEKYYIMVRWKDFASWDHCQVAWKGPGVPEQQIIQGNYLSPFEPVTAFGSNPGNGSVDVVIDTALGWKPGKFAVTSDVYLGTDSNDVNNVDASNLASYPNVTSASVTGDTYDPGLLDFNTTYYWRVDTINNAQADSPWKGKVWSFTTGNYLVIDDFEDYNDYPPNEVWSTWTDGYDNPTVNGSTMGYPNPDFANGEHYVETNIVHGGNQSSPLLYDNSTASFSEVTLSTDNLALGHDWTAKDFQVLSLWIYGDPNNTATEQMFVKLNNAKVTVNPNLTEGAWQEVTVDLAAFNTNLSGVTSLAIGFERTGATGSSGMVFIDDIRLNLPSPW